MAHDRLEVKLSAEIEAMEREGRSKGAEIVVRAIVRPRTAKARAI